MKNHNKTNSITNDELRITNETVIRNSKFVIDKGYKQTKIGIIPNDWEVKRLGEIGLPKMCKRIFKEETTTDGIPFYKIGTFGKVADAYISEEKFNDYKQKYSYPKIGDILISASGTIGRLVVYNGEKAYFQDSNIVWIQNDESIISNKLLFYMYKKVRWKVTEGGIIARLYNSDLKKILLPIPPLAEQKAIADCLTTWDKAIEKLTALITAKKTQKKALMQSIFNDELRIKNWKEVKFNDLYEKINSKNYQIKSKKYKNKGIYPIIDQGKSLIVGYSDDDNKVYKNYPVIVFGDHTRIVKYVDFEFVIGADGTKLFKNKNNNSILFLYYLLSFTPIINLGYSRHMRILKTKKFSVPPLAEQKEIANVLSTADKEIALLEQKLVALQTQKQGLMQVLLTGQLRITN